MVQLSKQERNFRLLFVQTTSAQRKALLRTITKHQLRALCQIAHNGIKFRIELTTAERATLKRERPLIHILGDRCLGYQHKREIVNDKQWFIYVLLKTVLPFMEVILK